MASYEEPTLNNLETDDANNDAENNPDDNQPCFLPHKQHTRAELNDEYPSLTAPDDFDQPGAENHEPLLDAGLRQAKEIAEAMRVHGRTKRDLTRGRAGAAVGSYTTRRQ